MTNLIISEKNFGAGVIWITGYSGAGKTTVGRKVEAQLRNSGFPTIFLDGDDLRSIFSNQWGYEREQRIELARVYFRLFSHLASQGYIVVISAVAMYKEIYMWVRTNIPRHFLLYLDVPEDERIRRDKLTKNIYSEKINLASLYDTPENFDLTLQNSHGVNLNDLSEKIVNTYHSLNQVDRNLGRREHWAEFYSGATVPSNPSPFAEFVSSRIKKLSRILEIGCGNGRDASFFARNGHKVTAIDLSDVAIQKCIEEHKSLGITFISGTLDLPSSAIGDGFDVLYSRFVIHAMPVEEEIAMLNSDFRSLSSGGTIHIECRSINDPLVREGEILSPTERIHGHYRRFIILDELKNRLIKAGFHIVNSIESDRLAVFGSENPVVIRIEGEKP